MESDGPVTDEQPLMDNENKRRYLPWLAALLSAGVACALFLGGYATGRNAAAPERRDATLIFPAYMDASYYANYLKTVTVAIDSPALEYVYPTTDAGAYYPVKGISMASGTFPGLQKQVEYIVNYGLEGDIYETGTWRGGASIFMLSVLRAYEKMTGKSHPNREYYGFDSFTGFKKQGENEALDQYLSNAAYTAPLDKVKGSFSKFGVLDNHTHFVKGFFEDTLPNFHPPNPIAILRLDGDLYSSTMVVLKHLYPHVQKGGWIIIDDYTWDPPQAKLTSTGQPTKLCGQAVDEYRQAHNITTPITDIYGDFSWQKE
jgi:hypothetical protein